VRIAAVSPGQLLIRSALTSNFSLSQLHDCLEPLPTSVSLASALFFCRCGWEYICTGLFASDVDVGIGRRSHMCSSRGPDRKISTLPGHPLRLERQDSRMFGRDSKAQLHRARRRLRKSLQKLAPLWRIAEPRNGRPFARARHEPLALRVHYRLHAPKGLPPLTAYAKTGYYAPTRQCGVAACPLEKQKPQESISRIGPAHFRE
jgi:hypothetical protein